MEQSAKALQDFRGKYQNLVNESKNRLGNLNKQIAQLRENTASLTKSLKEVTAERDQLKETQAAAAVTPSVDPSSTAELTKVKEELETLKAQKESAEKTLAEEMRKSAKTIADVNASLVRSSNHRICSFTYGYIGQNSRGA